MSRTTRHVIGGVVALMLALVLALVTHEDDAQAVIGRPLTPVSYAGVARRTTRRAAYTGAYAGAYAAPAVVASAAVVTTLPAGCVATGGYYACGAVRYAPAYNGTTVVYQQL